MLPRRADPVAGALAGTILLAAFLATPVLLALAIIWMMRRLSSGSRPDPQAEQDD